jgi:regulator of replication initiation timing
MDIATIGAAASSLKVVKDVFTWLLESKIEAESRTKVLEALKAVGDAQDNLYRLREELFVLQTENRDLKTKLTENEEWKARLAKYRLVETAGGAHVYRTEEGTTHFACPSCIEKKEIQILQDLQVMSGDFACPGCDKKFKVKPANYPAPYSGGGGGPWMR